MNDQQAVQMIQRQLAGELSANELAELTYYLVSSPQTADFAELSQRIQQVVAGDPESAAESGPGLSTLSKARIQRRLQQELADQHASPDRLERQVAEEDQDYRKDNREDSSAGDDDCGG